MDVVWCCGVVCKCFSRFSRAQFLITQQSGRTHPQLFSVITKQITAECQGNFHTITGVCRDRHRSSLLSLFFLLMAVLFTLRLKPKVQLHSLSPEPIIPCLGPVEIQFHNQSVELGINKDGAYSQWTAAFSFLSSVFNSHVPLSTALSFPLSPRTEKIMARSCSAPIIFCHTSSPQGVHASGCAHCQGMDGPVRGMTASA